MSFDPANAVPVEEFDPANAVPVDEPTSNAAWDMAKRAARGVVAGTGQLVQSVGSLGDAIAETLPDWAVRPDYKPGENPFTVVGRSFQQGAQANIPTDAARDTEIKSGLAEGVGTAAPALVAGVANPVAGVVALSAQMGEAERNRALAAGDSPELAAEKAKLGRLGGAVMGAVPLGPVRAGARPLELLATRAATGGAVNAAQDAGYQALTEDKVDWGRVKTSGAIGAGMGLVLGVPEALALRKALGTQGSHEGKTLAQALDEIAQETGVPAPTLAEQINQAVDVRPAPDLPAQTARRADAEAALAPVAERADYQKWWAETLAAEDNVRSAEPPSESSALPPPEATLSPDTLNRGQGGSISPAALLPVARAAVGGALGYATGDTPEERVRNGLIGLGAGALASPALVRNLTNRVLNSPVPASVRDIATRRLTELRLRIAPQSLLPEEIRTQLRWGEQASAAITNQGLSLSRDLEQGILQSGSAQARAALVPQVKAYLDGRVPAAVLPPTVRTSAEKVRNFLDALSDRAVAEGVVSGEMAQTFLDNRGTYLRRSYDIFLKPDYKPIAGAEQAAIAAVQRAKGLSAPEAEAIVAGILDKNGRAGLGDFLLGRGKVAGKDVSSLVRRQDLLPEIRVLLGEVRDPILAVNQTIPRLARLIEQDAAQKQVRDIGLRLGLFSPQQSLTHRSPLVADSSATHNQLTGLFAAPEIADAFIRQANSGRTAFVPEMLWKALTSASAVAKTAKTVYNPESYAPNALGGVIANLANGNFRYNHAARGLALGAEEMGALRKFLPRAPSRDALRTEIAELTKLGIVNQSVNGEDLLRSIESSFFATLKNPAKSILTAPAKLYGAIDDFNRYVAWQSERARYAKAFPGMPEPELKRRAAEIVRDTVPNYSAVPPIVKQLSVAGIAPSFVNFTWEVFRNTKNSVRLGLRDLAEGRATNNAGLVRAGAERLAAITAVTAAASMWGASKLSRDSHGITDEKDAAVRYFSPPWNRNGVLLYNTKAEAGQPVQVANLSYLVPHALLFQAIEAGRRGSEDGQTASEFLGALNEQFGFGNSVLIPPLAAAIQGFDPKTGRQIPSSAADPTLGDRTKYFANEALMPMFMDQAEKWRKALKGEASGDYGRVYSTEEQAKRLFGVRAQTFDPVESMKWKAGDLVARINRADSIYRLRLGQRKAASPEQLDAAYQQAEQARKVEFADLAKMITHARTLGITDEQTIAVLRTARMPAADILAAFDGDYNALPRDRVKTSADYLAELQALPMERRRAALAQIYREDPAMAKSVMLKAKEAAKGRTQYDGLLLTLDVSDGARAAYLRRKLMAIPDVATRRAWLLDLRRKGIATDKVLVQMADPKVGRN